MQSEIFIIKNQFSNMLNNQYFSIVIVDFLYILVIIFGIAIDFLVAEIKKWKCYGNRHIWNRTKKISQKSS